MSRYLDAIVQNIIKNLEEELESFREQAIEDYIDSEEFGKDASEYCREQGWREPE